ncbi:MAG: hypothetical protein WC346_17415 [Methanogenium sp.]|jgi:hypothetical protein
MNNNVYPTNEELKNIENWDNDWRALVEYVAEIMPHYGTVKITGKRKVKVFIATGGWSGCEDIIKALEKADSGMFWFCCWQKSERGGAFWFKLPEFT